MHHSISPMIYGGGPLNLFHPFALLAGVVSLALLVMHGASFAALHVEDPVGLRARRIARIAAAVTVIAFADAGVWLNALDGPVITSVIDPLADSNPLCKEFAVWAGA